MRRGDKCHVTIVPTYRFGARAATLDTKNTTLFYEMALVDVIETEDDGGMDCLDIDSRMLPFDTLFGLGRTRNSRPEGHCPQYATGRRMSRDDHALDIDSRMLPFDTFYGVSRKLAVTFLEELGILGLKIIVHSMRRGKECHVTIAPWTSTPECCLSILSMGLEELGILGLKIIVHSMRRGEECHVTIAPWTSTPECCLSTLCMGLEELGILGLKIIVHSMRRGEECHVTIAPWTSTPECCLSTLSMGLEELGILGLKIIVHSMRRGEECHVTIAPWTSTPECCLSTLSMGLEELGILGLKIIVHSMRRGEECHVTIAPWTSTPECCLSTLSMGLEELGILGLKIIVHSMRRGEECHVTIAPWTSTPECCLSTLCMGLEELGILGLKIIVHSMRRGEECHVTIAPTYRFGARAATLDTKNNTLLRDGLIVDVIEREDYGGMDGLDIDSRMLPFDTLIGACYRKHRNRNRFYVANNYTAAAAKFLESAPDPADDKHNSKRRKLLVNLYSNQTRCALRMHNPKLAYILVNMCLASGPHESSNRADPTKPGLYRRYASSQINPKTGFRPVKPTLSDFVQSEDPDKPGIGPYRPDDFTVGARKNANRRRHTTSASPGATIWALDYPLSPPRYPSPGVAFPAWTLGGVVFKCVAQTNKDNGKME
ncbi:hypothetical protein HPB49_009243 [Dermacentor silvarum]|uniref:Uncharacterized protein n=1 Tax=Dermacentor silvarum TaxID=543639 RepID=A0ACB8DYD6_DERSI|nr:hypothetical protein HPB49_009243 [Dermacentor silvarum]